MGVSRHGHSQVRTAILVVSGLVVALGVLLRTKWDTDGEPLRSWDWFGPPGLSPSIEFRQWFVRWSPLLIFGGLLIFGVALIAPH